MIKPAQTPIWFKGRNHPPPSRKTPRLPPFLRHRNYQAPNLPSVSDSMLSNKLRSPSCTDRQTVPIILWQPGCPNWLQADRLGKIPDQPRRQATVHPVSAERGGNLHVRVGNVKCKFGGAGGADPESRPRDDPCPPIPARIEGEIRLKNRLRRQWQITRDPDQKAEVNCLHRSVTHQLNKWIRAVEQHAGKPWSRGPVAVEDDKVGDENSHCLTSPRHSERQCSLWSRDSRSPGWQSWVLVPAGKRRVGSGSYWKVSRGAGSILLCPCNRVYATNPMEVQYAIWGLKLGKTPGPNGLQNRALKHLPRRAISFLVALFNVALLAEYFQPVWKYARLISIPKPGKIPSLPLSYRPISLLDTISKLFEKILLRKILSEVNGCCIMRDKQLGSDPHIARVFSWCASLREWLGTPAGRAWQARFFSTLYKPTILFGSMVSYSS
jgi:hypothetical protein